MARATYYTTVKIGPKRSLTPEGFLLCEDVPIARTGVMEYGPDETPIKGKPNQLVIISRDADALFAPITIASGNGKDITNDHPDDDVTPDNVKELSVGVMMNLRRGESVIDDLLLADLLIKDPQAIQDVLAGKREVSLGYDADYDQTGDAAGTQTNIIINHVALVEQGRCGPRCAIKDHALTLKESSMSAKRSKILDALFRAFKAKDADELEAIAKDAEGELGGLAESSEGENHTHIHIHNGEVSAEPVNDEEDPENDPKKKEEKQFTLDDETFAEHVKQNAAEHQQMRDEIEALKAKLDSLAPVRDEDEESDIPAEAMDEIPEELKEKAKEKTADSALFSDSFRDTVAMAEILVPGIRVPTFDGKAKPGATFKAICGLRKTALDTAYATADTHAIIDTILGGKVLDTSNMSCDAIRTVFRAAAAARRASNNDANKSAPAVKLGRNGKPIIAPVGIKTLADINRRNAEHYGAKS